MLSVGPTDDVTNRMVRHMTYTPPTTAGLAVEPNTSLAQSGRIASPSGQLTRMMPLMRKYEVAHLTPSLEIHDAIISAPAVPLFENAFAAFGHGAIVHTECGPMAVEDLLPGDRVMTTHHGMQTLMWRGAMSLSPNDQNLGTMTRITAEALGMGRPSLDLVLGPSARILHRSPAVQVLTGAAEAMIPVSDFADGSQIIALRPVSRVQFYQLGFAKHTSINVNGIDVETLHPGPVHTLKLRADMQAHFSNLFAHMDSPAAFGPLAAPRLRKDDIDLVMAA